MTGRQLAARNELVDWQVAPAEYEIANYDEPKIRYRQYVEQFVSSIPMKNLRKKIFYTISTNVLCADIQSSKSTVEPIDRDLYLPLEISLTKWSLTAGKVPEKERPLQTSHWMINPGLPTRNSIYKSMEHAKSHKIMFDDETKQNTFIEEDLEKVMKEINSYLSADRVVFSLGLKYARQDLGSLKWLNKVTGCKSRPIKVFNIEDLYVVLGRRFDSSLDLIFCQSVARNRMDNIVNAYDIKRQCDYHKALADAGEDETRFCTRSLAIGWSNVLINDMVLYCELFDDDKMPCSSNNTVAPVKTRGH